LGFTSMTSFTHIVVIYNVVRHVLKDARLNERKQIVGSVGSTEPLGTSDTTSGWSMGGDKKRPTSGCLYVLVYRWLIADPHCICW